MAGPVGLAGGAAYGASKAALTAMTHGWAAEFSSSSVRINSVAPAPVYTDGANDDLIGQLGATTLRHRAAQRAEIRPGHRAARLSRASYVTAAMVDGGRTPV
ncbi:MAG: SDR family NAD(P)-dependent oxidoreductase [Pseudonocardiaceae bacterium]